VRYRVVVEVVVERSVLDLPDGTPETRS